MLAEIATALGAGAGAFLAAYGAAHKLRGRQKDANGQEPSTRAIFARLDRFEADVRELRERALPPDLSERMTRLEDDVRENANATGARLDKLMEKLGEVRGTLEAFLRGGDR